MTLEVVQPSALGEAGVALTYTSNLGTQAISVMAVISTFPAGFNVLYAEVEIPNQIT